MYTFNVPTVDVVYNVCKRTMHTLYNQCTQCVCGIDVLRGVHCVQCMQCVQCVTEDQSSANFNTQAGTGGN